MAGVLILIIGDVGSMRDVFEEIENLSMVREVRMLAGFYDTMVIAESDKLSEIMARLLGKSEALRGLRKLSLTSLLDKYQDYTNPN